MDVYRSHGLKHGPVSNEDQMKRLEDAIKKDDFTSNDDGAKKDDEWAHIHLKIQNLQKINFRIILIWFLSW